MRGSVHVPTTSSSRAISSAGSRTCSSIRPDVASCIASCPFSSSCSSTLISGSSSSPLAMRLRRAVRASVVSSHRPRAMPNLRSSPAPTASTTSSTAAASRPLPPSHSRFVTTSHSPATTPAPPPLMPLLRSATSAPFASSARRSSGVAKRRWWRCGRWSTPRELSGALARWAREPTEMPVEAAWRCA